MNNTGIWINDVQYKATGFIDDFVLKAESIVIPTIIPAINQSFDIGVSKMGDILSLLLKFETTSIKLFLNDSMPRNN